MKKENLLPTKVSDAHKSARQGMLIIEEKRAKLRKETETPEKTSGIFKYSEDPEYSGKTHDLKKINNIRFLIGVLGFLLQTKDYYDKGCKLLKFTEYDSFKWQGYSIEAWTEDIEKRIKLLSYEQEIKNLEEASNILSKYLSEEDKMIADIQKLIDLGILPKYELKITD